MTKKAIRKEFIEKRLQLPAAEIQSFSAKMIRHFEELEFPLLEHLLTYYPLLERNEFNVEPCMQYLRNIMPGIRIACPKINDESISMEAYLINEDVYFDKNKYGILEPISGEIINPELIDMIFVPMVMCDENGYRVGYGKGYYDRYLARCRPDIMKVGFSFFDPIPLIEGIDQFDVPLNVCITPSGKYEF